MFLLVSSNDAPIGRKQILTPPPVKVVAKKYDLQILQPTNIKSLPLAHWERGRGVRADVIIVIAYGQIIPPDILAMPKYGCLNLHASLLPKHRGASPIQSAIAAGDKTSGVTLMKMDSGLDTGPIIAQTKLNIATDETGDSLHDKLARLSAKTLLQYLPGYLTGKLTPQPQAENQATYAPKLTRQSGRIDWRKPAEEIERLVRAYYPWPGTWTKWQEKILKIIEVDKNILKINKDKVGQIFLHNGRPAIQCGHSSLIINRLQLAGKQVVTGQEFISGYGQKINNC